MCAVVALWDILLHPIQDWPYQEEDFLPRDHDVIDGMTDFFDADQMLMFHWKPHPAKSPRENDLLAGAAETLNVEQSRINTQALLEKHRLWVFKVDKDNTTVDRTGSFHTDWEAFVSAPPQGRLTEY